MCLPAKEGHMCSLGHFVLLRYKNNFILASLSFILFYVKLTKLVNILLKLKCKKEPSPTIQIAFIFKEVELSVQYIE